MPYQTDFVDITYPDETGQPCALTFRIAITASSERLAVVHLRRVNPAFQSPMNSYIVRDQLLNRILDSYLRGIPLKSVRLVVEDGDKTAMFPIEVDSMTTSSAEIRMKQRPSRQGAAASPNA